MLQNIKQIDNAQLDELVWQAQQSPRRRAHLNLHESLDDPVQRLVVAMELDSYIRPHHHPQPEKWELRTVLRGVMQVLLFDKQGVILDKLSLAAGGPNFCIEIPSNTWHTLLALESGSVFSEVKQGPYIPFRNEDFAQWSPAEQIDTVVDFMHWLRQAKMGDSAQNVPVSQR